LLRSDGFLDADLPQMFFSGTVIATPASTASSVTSQSGAFSGRTATSGSAPTPMPLVLDADQNRLSSVTRIT
jgi:hypothetical protein